MLSQLNPVEVWSNPVTPRELYDVERQHRLVNGGGQLYFQVNKTKVPGLLRFLGLQSKPPLGAKQWVTVKDPTNPTAPASQIAFWLKSQDRMRTGAQNRWFSSSTRPSGWGPAAGFPSLGSNQTRANAEAILTQLNGLRLFLARDAAGDVWAGFTQGSPSPADAHLPYADVAWAPSTGGYWHA
jgi:hypothetical protein